MKGRRNGLTENMLNLWKKRKKIVFLNEINNYLQEVIILGNIDLKTKNLNL